MAGRGSLSKHIVSACLAGCSKIWFSILPSTMGCKRIRTGCNAARRRTEDGDWPNTFGHTRRPSIVRLAVASISVEEHRGKSFKQTLTATAQLGLGKLTAYDLAVDISRRLKKTIPPIVYLAGSGPQMAAKKLGLWDKAEVHEFTYNNGEYKIRSVTCQQVVKACVGRHIPHRLRWVLSKQDIDGDEVETALCLCRNEL